MIGSRGMNAVVQMSCVSRPYPIFQSSRQQAQPAGMDAVFGLFNVEEGQAVP